MPALIVFAREPVAGCAKTRLIPALGAASAARLADAFIHDTLAKAARMRNCGLIIAGTCSGPVRRSGYFRGLAHRFGGQLVDQGEGDLGQRMERMLRRYAEPAGAVLMGTDVPSLPPEFIGRSIEDLRHAGIVIAPALDGGYYLVGIRGQVPPIFEAMKWGGSRVMEQTLRRLRRLHIPYRLGPWWYDIDRGIDVDLLVRELIRGKQERSHCPATFRLLREIGLLAARRGSLVNRRRGGDHSGRD